MSRSSPTLLTAVLAIALTHSFSLRGDEVRIGDSVFAVQAPILKGNENTEEQTAAIESAIRGLPLRQFSRDSVVAPVRIQLKYLRDPAQVKIGHDVHALFIVHTNLEEFSPEEFATRLAGKNAKSKDLRVEDVPSSVLASLDLETNEGVVFKAVELGLLEKIQLSGLFEFRSSRRDGQRRIDFRVVDEHDNSWRSLKEPDQGGTYQGLVGHFTATELKDGAAVLIEVRLLMHEPEGWFAGSNFLRSKLPLVLQEAARDIRRSLKK